LCKLLLSRGADVASAVENDGAGGTGPLVKRQDVLVHDCVGIGYQLDKDNNKNGGKGIICYLCPS
jgi:hypothetical protein